MPIWFQELVQYQLQKYTVTAKSKRSMNNLLLLKH